jgi:hypothetical protein
VIQLTVQGADSVGTDGQGNLVLATPVGNLTEHAPVIYQDVNGVQQAVSGQFVVEGGNQVGFQVGAYDASQPLVIDPVLGYSTYFGGSGDDYAAGIAVDGAGNAYITGYTASANFPTLNPPQGAYSGSGDAFVAKFNPTGTLIYSTYVGGSAQDNGSSIAVDAAGAAYITGQTYSTNFPTQNALQNTYGGSADAFVTKLSPSGSSLSYSTYLGGSGYEVGYGIAVSATGNAYVTGSTGSTNFPTQAPYQAIYAQGGADAFVSEFNTAGSALVYSTYFGGPSGDTGWGIALDGAGDAYIVGDTGSTNLSTQNAFQGTSGGSDDAFIAKFNPTGSSLIYSSYLGGSGADIAFGVAVDSAGNAYVTGDTTSTNFPTQNAYQGTYGGGSFDAFVAKVSADGTSLIYSTYLGGSNYDIAHGITVDTTGNAYVVGDTFSTDFPTLCPTRNLCHFFPLNW